MSPTVGQSVPFVFKGPSFLEGAPEMVEINRFRQQIFDKNALFLFDSWISKCSSNGIPNKSDIDPLDFFRLLDRTYIEEWDERRQQSVIKLAGDLHNRIYGGNVRGLAVDDHCIGEKSRIFKQCDKHNFHELCPTFCGYSLVDVNSLPMTLADLTLPIRDKRDGVQTVGVISLL